MSKSKSDWTDENRNRYIDLIRAGLNSKEARKAVEQSKKINKKGA